MEEIGAMIGYAQHDRPLLNWLLLMLATGARPRAAMKMIPVEQLWRDHDRLDLQPKADPLTQKRNPIVPVIKISANPRTVRTMGEHIDVDVSGILRRDMTIDQAGDALIENIVRTANGRNTSAEVLGHREFVMTKLYRSA